MELHGVNGGIPMVSLKLYLRSFHYVLLLKQLAKRWITGPSYRFQREQSLISHFLQMFVKT